MEANPERLMRVIDACRDYRIGLLTDSELVVTLVDTAITLEAERGIRTFESFLRCHEGRCNYGNHNPDSRAGE